MNDPLDLKLKVDNAKLKQEIARLHALIANNETLLVSKEQEINNLRSQIEILTKKSAGFQKMYFEASKLGERQTSSTDPHAN
jgi:hypothetical protein